jgi:tape measure domain-containing protein
MAQPLSWLIKLYDGVTGPAKAATAGVESLAEGMGAGKKEAGEFDKELKKVRDQLARIKANPNQFKELKTAREELKKLRGDGDSFWTSVKKGAGMHIGELGVEAVTSGLVGAAQTFAGIIKGAFDLATGLASKMVTAGAEAESLGLSYELLLGKEGGAQALKDIDALAGKTKFDDDDLAKAIRPLLLGGMKPGKAMFDALAAATDIETLTGGGLGTVQTVLAKIGKVQAKGGIGTKELEEFGINVQDFYRNLGTSLGQTSEAVKKRVAEGKLSPDVILGAVYKAVADKQGGALGVGAERGAATVEGKLMKLQNLPENYFKKVVDSPSWAKLSDLLGGLLERLDPEGPTGQRVFGALEKFFTAIVGDANTILDNLKPEDIASGVEVFVSGLRDAVAVVREIVGGLRTAVDLVSGETLSKAIFTGDEGTQRVNLVERMRKNGASQDQIRKIMKDLAPSERADLDALWRKQGVDMGAAVIAGVRGPEGIDAHSPSRKMEALGKMAREGFEQGMGGLSIDTSLPRGGVGAGGARSLSLGGVHVHVAGGEATKDPQALAAAVDERLQQSLLQKLLTALDTMGAQQGVADDGD